MCAAHVPQGGCAPWQGAVKVGDVHDEHDDGEALRGVAHFASKGGGEVKGRQLALRSLGLHAPRVRQLVAARARDLQQLAHGIDRLLAVDALCPPERVLVALHATTALTSVAPVERQARSAVHTRADTGARLAGLRERKPTKMWPGAYHEELAEALILQHGVVVRAVLQHVHDNALRLLIVIVVALCCCLRGGGGAFRHRRRRQRAVVERVAHAPRQHVEPAARRLVATRHG